jgi:DNA-binding FadR family transcriptional regulator
VTNALPWSRSSRVSKALELANDIEQGISQGVLQSGDRLGTREEIRLRYAVATATVNEAVKLLDSRGLVIARPGPGGGLFVASPESRKQDGPMMLGAAWVGATMQDYHEARSLLEPTVVRHAAAYRRPADLLALDVIVERMRQTSEDPVAYARNNTGLHLRIAQMTRNAPLRSFYVTLIDFFQHQLDTDSSPAVVAAHNVEVHEHLVDAIRRGPGPWVDEAIHRHDVHRAGGAAEGT